MYLRNWEHNATSGTPVSGATVEARLATLTSPNVGAVVASTTTNADGMWEFPTLADAAHDIKVTYLGNVWWHKGLTKHNVDAIFYNNALARTDQFMRNAGFETGVAAGPWTVTNVEQTVFDSWKAINGTGSSAALSKDTTTVATGSLTSAKLVQTKVAGTLFMYQNMLAPASWRGKVVTFSVQVHQSVASSVIPYISDNVGINAGAASATTGSWITLTVTRTVDAAATSVQIGIQVTLSSTVYVDNTIAVLGAVAGTYGPEYQSAGQITSDLLASGAAVANIGYSPVNKAGDTMTGALVMPNNIPIYAKTTTAVARNLASMSAGNEVIIGDTNHPLLIQTSGDLRKWTGAAVSKIWSEDNDGPSSGLSAQFLGGQDWPFFVARSNHTGTQPAVTISDFAVSVAATGDSRYSLLGHLHTGVYADAAHNHSGVYATAAHNHAGVYADAAHTHAGGSRIVTGTYVGDGAANKSVATGLTTLYQVWIQRVSGGAGTMWNLMNHDAMTFISGSSPVLLIGMTFSGGSFNVTSASGANVAGANHRFVAYGV